ncbi:hypothetical protein [Halovenus marina]|uniref:hypothetical protein n=1 Tax=Halovenus marina TaxID=3396621 RepID=UPI003F565C82
MGLGDIFGGDDSSDGDDEPTDLQADILRMASQNPDMTTSMIAARLDCSHSYVSETLRVYGDWGEADDGDGDDDSDGLGELFG